MAERRDNDFWYYRVVPDVFELQDSKLLFHKIL